MPCGFCYRQFAVPWLLPLSRPRGTRDRGLGGWQRATTRPRALGVATDPLQIGFTSEQQQLIELINQQTNPEARVLWDETFNNRPYWNWSALLPALHEKLLPWRARSGIGSRALILLHVQPATDGAIPVRVVGRGTGGVLPAVQRWLGDGQESRGDRKMGLTGDGETGRTIDRRWPARGVLHAESAPLVYLEWDGNAW